MDYSDLECVTEVIAAIWLLHRVSRYEPAIAAQDQYPRRLVGISNHLGPQSRNAMRLQ
jgi:hypothetical protein